MVVNDTLQLTAIPTGGLQGQVQWQVIGGATNGTVSADGTYRAPANAGTYQVRVSLVSNPNINATATIHVDTTVGISIVPATVKGRYQPNEKVQFNATLQGIGSDKISWRVSDPAGGIVSSTGQYTAPTAPGFYEVICQSNLNAAKKASYFVLVSATKVIKMTYDDLGAIYIQMAEAQAPGTTANFVSLCTQHFYDGTFMHRYGPDEGQPQFIQGGDPLTKDHALSDPLIGTGGPGYTIPFEVTGLKHEVGAFAMARTNAGLDTAGSQFYICQEKIPSFDGNYCVFGKVIGNLSAIFNLRKGNRVQTAEVIP
jgi:peptidyl-prolyl cis-trans isomerase B (cyclophilin B)